MGDRVVVPVLRLLAVALLVATATGCASYSKVTNRRLIQHQAMIDFSGLAPRGRSPR